MDGIAVAVFVVVFMALAVLTIQTLFHDRDNCSICAQRRAQARLDQNDWLEDYFREWR
jgi:hypothetical protein